MVLLPPMSNRLVGVNVVLHEYWEHLFLNLVVEREILLSNLGHLVGRYIGVCIKHIPSISLGPIGEVVILSNLPNLQERLQKERLDLQAYLLNLYDL